MLKTLDFASSLATQTCSADFSLSRVEAAELFKATQTTQLQPRHAESRAAGEALAALQSKRLRTDPGSRCTI